MIDKKIDYDFFQSLISMKKNLKKTEIVEMWPHIEHAKRSGFTYYSIWEVLTKDEKINVSYSYFMKIAKSLDNKNNRESDKKPKNNLQKESKIKKKSFYYNPSYNEDDLI